MNKPDLINGLFEIATAAILLLNIKQILKHKELKGVSWIPTLLFTLWGYWNLYYYPSLNQWISFIGGVFLALINSIWLFLVFYYEYLKRNEKN